MKTETPEMSEPLFETPVLGPATAAARERRERREAARQRARRRFSVGRFVRGVGLGALYVALLGGGMLALVTVTPLSRLAFWFSWPLSFVIVQSVLVLAILWSRQRGRR